MSVSIAQEIDRIESALQVNFAGAHVLCVRGKNAYNALAQITEDVDEIQHLDLKPGNRSFKQRLSSLIEKGYHTAAQNLINQRTAIVSSDQLIKEIKDALDQAYDGSPSNTMAFENSLALTQQSRPHVPNATNAPRFGIAA